MDCKPILFSFTVKSVNPALEFSASSSAVRFLMNSAWRMCKREFVAIIAAVLEFSNFAFSNSSTPFSIEMATWAFWNCTPRKMTGVFSAMEIPFQDAEESWDSKITGFAEVPAIAKEPPRISIPALAAKRKTVPAGKTRLSPSWTTIDSEMKCGDVPLLKTRERSLERAVLAKVKETAKNRIAVRF